MLHAAYMLCGNRALQLAIIFLVLEKFGFLTKPQGKVLLFVWPSLASPPASFFCEERPNEKALNGTKVLILGKTKRFDKRQIVYARNELIPGTEP